MCLSRSPHQTPAQPVHHPLPAGERGSNKFREPGSSGWLRESNPLPPTVCQASGHHGPGRAAQKSPGPERVGSRPKVTCAARLVPAVTPAMARDHQGPGWLSALSQSSPCPPACLPALPGSRPPLGPTWSKQDPQGPRPFYMAIYCPKWGGASCPGLKGPEAGRQPAQWELFSGGKDEVMGIPFDP